MTGAALTVIDGVADATVLVPLGVGVVPNASIITGRQETCLLLFTGNTTTDVPSTTWMMGDAIVMEKIKHATENTTGNT